MSKKPMTETPNKGTKVRLFLPWGGYADVWIQEDKGLLMAKSIGTRQVYAWAALDKSITWEYV